MKRQAFGLRHIDFRAHVLHDHVIVQQYAESVYQQTQTEAVSHGKAEITEIRSLPEPTCPSMGKRTGGLG